MASLLTLTPDTLEFVLLSFEGPDQYAMAGGLGVRMKELALELARQGATVVVNDRGVHDRQFMRVQKDAIATAAFPSP